MKSKELHDKHNYDIESIVEVKLKKENSFTSSLPDNESFEENNDEKFKQSKSIKFLRRFMIVLLVIAACTSAGLTYFYVSNVEKNQFLVMYDASTAKVVEIFQERLNSKVWSSKTLANLYTSRFKNNSLWPYVTLDDFPEHASSELELAQARALSFNPIISGNYTIMLWQNYSKVNSECIVGKKYSNLSGDWSIDDGIYKIVNGTRVHDEGCSSSRYPYTLVPVYQIYPLQGNEKAIMFNLRSEAKRQRALDDMLYYKVPTLTEFLQLVQDSEERPSSILFHPIFKNFNEIEQTVVGSISVVFSWDDLLENILPGYIGDLTCVIKTNSGQCYTYSVSGNKASLLGEGDLHETKYNHMRKTTGEYSITNFVTDRIVSYKLCMYPSTEFENNYSTRKPLYFMLGVLFIFLFTSAVFISYDYLVQYNYLVVSQMAANSSRIVQSLFPPVVRDRLFAMNQSSVTAIDKSPTIKISEFLRRGTNNFCPQEKNAFSSFKCEPIADEFPSTTIMFADIAGFTSWSSDRTPQHVFRLLETLFKEFDRIAKKLGVFKVETIGDCYVAVCGLPDPRDDHAVVMAQFALECQRKFKQVMSSLEDINADILCLRSGLHSGIVTAGILRGEKCRFQLFGDTMNTASRMESTGVPTKVQISVQTAELLSKAGKSHWFVPREDLVTVKGKGTLQTYWLIPTTHDKDTQMKRGSIRRRISLITRRVSNSLSA